MDFKRLREAYGLSVQDMHSITGIPLRTLQGWDYGERKISPYLYYLIEFFLKHRKENEKLKRNEETNK